MIPKDCKRLAEVDFPISTVSKYAAAEKLIRHGHPSTIHLWWARRPLAACRAVLMALLLPDPCDALCPDQFKSRARNVLSRVQGHSFDKDETLRAELMRFIGDFCCWGNSSKIAYLDCARALVRAAHGDEACLVFDPFAGGGAIPFEALRLGCDSYASDLNPVACLIEKVMLDVIPRSSGNVAEELRAAGEAIRESAGRELRSVYPSDADGATPIAYIWARTITCDSCGGEVPLVRRQIALRYTVSKSHGNAVLTWDIFNPKKESEVPSPTITRGKATCPACHLTMAAERVRTQLKSQRGGADVQFDKDGSRCGGALLLAIAMLKEKEGGRHYRLASRRDYDAVYSAVQAVMRLASQTTPTGESLVPDETLPLMSGTFNAPLYGVQTWGDLFSARQKFAMLTLAKKIGDYATAKHANVTELLALALGKTADLGNASTPWKPDAECPVHLFSGQRIPAGLDYAEAVLTGESSGSFASAVDRTANTLESAFSFQYKPGAIALADARQSGLPSDSTDVYFTDPPYYFAVPYADLSDFFYVWLKRTLPPNKLLRDPFDKSNSLTPKDQELCEMSHWDMKRYSHKDKQFFETGMAAAFAEGRRTLKDDGIGCVVFAHKTTEGWEALLSGMVKGGWVITGSWPIATEMETRIRARDSAALATSVHLICRPRPSDATIGDWADVLRELPKRVGDWIERLQREGVRGADLVFACIGPAMEVYSRYRRVEDAEGREIPLGGDPTASEPYKRGFLAYVWETVGRLALEQVLGTAEARARNGAAGALEEDSRLTALFLWTLQTTEATTNGDVATNIDESTEDEDEEEKPTKKKPGLTLIYDVARRFAQPLGIHLDKWEGRIIETEKGVVRLLPVAERAMQLFGDVDASAISRRIEQDVKASRNYTFAFMQDVAAPPEIRPRGRRKGTTAGAAVEEAPTAQTVTTLDRVHAAMLLQASGQANGLRAMLKEEQQRGPDFLRLANALSALYPKASEEKRLLDAMLLAVPRN